ncbi:MAG: adenylosuccinate synthetase, partial [Armatimonadetes bacterium]|nr:adenylosuccinate synthetase [Armatimonadota bacterium]
MSTLVIVGAQWGDEAKGKMVDVLAREADVVVRYSGGNNAGHTVIIGDQTFKFQLLPAGILHTKVTSVLGGGMAICPKSLLEEIAATKEQQKNLGDLAVSPAAHVVFPYHRLLDKLEEEARGENKIGTTSRGIGPAYTDKVQRIGIRMGEFVHAETFRRRLEEVLAAKNRLMQMFGEPPICFDELYDEYYGSSAWRYGSQWLGLLKIWHGQGDYPYSAAGCAYFKLVTSRDGLNWEKVGLKNSNGQPEVFIANGKEGGNNGQNDGGYMTDFSQGPIRIGDELVFYYGCTSYGKNHPD